jgi:hypothetical protein
MKIEVARRTEAFKSVLWSAMDALGTDGTFEVPYEQLNYVANLVHQRNKEGRGEFRVITVPVFESDKLTGEKTVHVVRTK